MREEFRKTVDAMGSYYYFFNKLCDAISDKDLKKMLKREGMI